MTCIKCATSKTIRDLWDLKSLKQTKIYLPRCKFDNKLNSIYSTE